MKMTGKGQITIPPAMRKRHGLVPRAEVELVDRPEGILVMKAAKPSGGKQVLNALLRGGKIKTRTRDWLQLTRGGE
jgi:bifunctional DNA-binding transcriptional regulator/antitoxin component of YhaV-PrlF toxin-antitoxin module